MTGRDGAGYRKPDALPLLGRIALGCFGLSMAVAALFSAVETSSSVPRTVHSEWSQMALSSPGPCVAVGMFWVCGTYGSDKDCMKALNGVGGSLISPMSDRIQLSCLRRGDAWNLQAPMT